MQFNFKTVLIKILIFAEMLHSQLSSHLEVVKLTDFDPLEKLMQQHLLKNYSKRSNKNLTRQFTLRERKFEYLTFYRYSN